ncbi:hypothetical protein [Bradyrhizobium sp. DASA03120]|uniref:hypothetical protein n=1 Tax=Bradyrhizobium sp. SMVTL-02 TaxID=3395917 RepID=UPI003F7254B8
MLKVAEPSTNALLRHAETASMSLERREIDQSSTKENGFRCRSASLSLVVVFEEAPLLSGREVKIGHGEPAARSSLGDGVAGNRYLQRPRR